MQRVILNAEFSHETAQDLIKYFASSGFSVTAKQEGKTWHIAAIMLINLELEKEAKQATDSMGITSSFPQDITFRPYAGDA